MRTLDRGICGSGKTAGRRAGGHAGNQYFLPERKEGGIAFGQDPKAVEAITKEMKKYAKQPVIMKLSPNVTDITEMARAAEAGGADALSLINTITGMKIDINRRKFVLANKTGGMSVKPFIR